MNYGELRAHFLDLLMRDDCTDALADRFISSGIRRVERTLRTPLQRKIVNITIEDPYIGFIPVPSDYLGIFSVSVNGTPITRITPGQADLFTGFIFDKGVFRFNPDVSVGDVVTIDYYAEFAQGVSDETTTNYSNVLPDMIIYAALTFAALFYIDSRKDSFDAEFMRLRDEAQMMADMDEMVLQVITPYGGGLI